MKARLLANWWMVKSMFMSFKTSIMVAFGKIVTLSGDKLSRPIIEHFVFSNFLLMEIKNNSLYKDAFYAVV